MARGNQKHLTIKELPLRIRPRERLISEGASNLSDAELLAIILTTGTKGINSLQLSQMILSHFENLSSLGNATFEELAGLDGVGAAKAAQLLASVELGRRVVAMKPRVRLVLNNPPAVASLLMASMRYLEREHFKALILNTKNQLLKIVDVAVGTLNAAIIHPRELYKTAIRANGAGVIVAHNHPSGDTKPSREDIALTRRLVEAGKILGIDFLDHVIIGDGKFLSMKEKNYF